MAAERIGARQRPKAVRSLVRTMTVVLLLTACASSPEPTPIGASQAPGPSVPELAAAEVSGHGITMQVTAEPAVVAAGEPIEVEAILTVDGPAPMLVTGSGAGIVSFMVTRVDDGLTSGPGAFTGDCARHELPAGEPIIVPFSKSGGWSPDDPNADFLETYFADPELRLPAGTWRIDVATNGTLGEGCTGPSLDLATSLVITVTE